MSQEMPPFTVVGIDPGTQRCGWAMLRFESRATTLVHSDTILGRHRLPMIDRVVNISRQLSILRAIHGIPAILAIEAGFIPRVKGSKSFSQAAGAMAVGIARGVAIAAYDTAPVIKTYAPATVKASVLRGNATKPEIARVVRLLLKIPDKHQFRYEDESDAIAVAWCGLNDYLLSCKQPRALRGIGEPGIIV